MPKQNYVSQKLAQWVLELRSLTLPSEVVETVRKCTLDGLGCAVAGHLHPAVKVLDRMAHRTYKSGSVPIWMHSGSLSPIGAALINSGSMSILDIDDGNREAMGHPGASVIPVALAIAQVTNANPTDLQKAIVAGYEVSVRAGAAEVRPSYHSGNYTSFGAAVAAGYLLELTADQLAHAIGICAYHGSRVSDLTQSQEMGSHVKESIPWSVVVGICAAELAREDFTGNRDALDIGERFNRAVLMHDLGNGFAIQNTYFKKYSCCRWVHSSTEALLQVIRVHNLSVDDITQVNVETFTQAARLNNRSDPPTLESAQYSMPYAMALVATRGEDALMPMSQSALHDPDAVALAEKISVSATNAMNAKFPAQVPAQVTVWTGEKKYSQLVLDPWGEASRSPRYEELADKFRVLAKPHMSDDHVDKLISEIQGDPFIDLRNLHNLLSI